HSAGKRFNQHPPELLAPFRGGLTRRGEHVHRIQPLRHVIVPYGCFDDDTIAVPTAPASQICLERARSDEESAPRHSLPIEYLEEKLQALLTDEATEKPDDRHIVRPAELCSDSPTRGRVG